MRIEELKKELELKQKKTARKYLLAIIVVGIIVGGLSGVTAYSFSAKQVSFTPSNKSWKVNNVNDAIESLQLSKTSTNYSEEEQVVGTWIDGKPLYQKTVYIGSLSDKSNVTVNHGISSLERIVDVKGTVKENSNNIWYMIPITHDQDSTTWTTKIQVSSTAIDIINRNGDYSNTSECYITLQYTKTTDTATTS